MEINLVKAFSNLVASAKASNLINSKQIRVPVTVTDLREGTLLVAAQIPPSIPFVFHSFRRQEDVKKFLDEAKPSHVPFKPIRIGYDASTIEPPKPPSPTRRRALAEKFKENLPFDKSHTLILRAGKFEGRLPGITAKLSLSGIDGTDKDPVCVLPEIQVLYDTGAEITVISDGLLDEGFREYLANETHDPYSLHSDYVQVTAVFCFANKPLRLDTVAAIRPQKQMPNELNGVILGQKAAIECIVTRLVPRNFIEDLGDEFWGEIHIEKSFDFITRTVTEY